MLYSGSDNAEGARATVAGDDAAGPHPDDFPAECITKPASHKALTDLPPAYLFLQPEDLIIQFS